MKQRALGLLWGVAEGKRPSDRSAMVVVDDPAWGGGRAVRSRGTGTGEREGPAIRVVLDDA